MSEEFQVRCVRPKDEGDSPASSTLQEAFDLLKEHAFNPSWITQEECRQVEDGNKNCYFVMDPFQGAAFEHLKLVGCRVYGPQCILSTLLMKIEIPRRKHPIYNLAMKEVVVSCTNLDHPTRNKVHDLVELMGGQVVRALTEDVTHLIAGEVGSQKYVVAAGRGKQIMTLDWVVDIWEKATHRYVSALEEQFLKFRCPIFKGLIVTASGLTAEERKKVKRYIESEGGTYTGEMKLNECTHLIIKEPTGTKYEFARKWKINIVTMRWLSESLDKNFCQDEKNYPVTGENTGVKTSTPERSRKSVQVPNIIDISAISTGLTHVDETAFQSTCLTTGMSDTTLDNVDLMELSQATTEPFLDSCKVYLSGIKGPLLEKCKKIINAGGGTRFNGINECVTHVVVGDKVDVDIETLKSMEQRPHVVSSSWLAECFQKRQLVSEQLFISPYLPPPTTDVQLPKVKVPRRKPSGKGGSERRPEGRHSATDEGDRTFATINNGDGSEMAELLSQYLDDGTGNNNGNWTALAMDEVDGNATVAYQNDDLTQDPNSQSTNTEEGVFARKTFILCGFSEQHYAALAEMVLQAGGRLIKERTRKVPDFAVVPLTGFPVEQTVGEVATNAWLQVCIESQALLDVSGHPLFQPIDINETARPLENCVLSVSGYSGVERDCLIHLADLLGAVCQEYFVRKANKSLQANTHLIVKEASGTKYTAALKWNIPPLSREWLLACAKSGKREDEQKYHINSIQSSGLTAETKPPSSESCLPTPSTTNSTGEGNKKASTSKASAPNKDAAQTTETGSRNKAVASTSDTRAENKHKLTNSRAASMSSVSPQVTETRSTDSNTQNGSSSNFRRSTLSATSARNTVPSSSAEMGTSDSAEKLPSSSASEGERTQQKQAELSNPMAGAKAMVERNTRHLSQKENITVAMTTPNRGKGVATPVVEKRGGRSRVEELQQQSRRPVLSPGVESPSVFLAPGFRANFSLTGVYNYLQSPDLPAKSKKRESLPLEEVFQHYLGEGVKSSAVERDIDPAAGASQSEDDDRGPLFGVVISVSKKLCLNQMEYNSIVTELGGEYTWQLSQQCTHFIFQGRANDTNKEFRQAKSMGKFIISPHWLYACVEERTRADESMYPVNYNPSMNLGGVVKTDTPGGSRSTRRSARNTPKPGEENTQSMAIKTTSRRPNPIAHTAIGTVNSTVGSTPRVVKQKVWEESMAQMKNWQDETKASAPKPAKDSHNKSWLEFSADTSRSKRSSETSRSDRSSESSRSKRLSSELSHEEHAQDGFERFTRLGSVGDEEGEKSGDKTNGEEMNAVEVAEAPGTRQAAKTPEAATAEDAAMVTPAICDALSKTLENFKASSSSRSKRASKRRIKKSDASSSGGQMDTSGNDSDAGRQARQHHQHPAHTPVHDSHLTEASQSLQVTWDDPTGRREQEKLAHMLERVSTPSQNTEDFMAEMEIPELDETPVTSKTKSDIPRKIPHRSPTPEPPPLAFPTAKNVSRVAAPQPVELLSDESSDDHTNGPASPPVILISGLQQQERVEYAALVDQLGGTVLDKQQFDPACTHVIVGQPTRNEKFLAAVATGRWVLHKSYFIACRQEGRFVREEDHEWGNPTMSSLLATMNAQTNKLAAAAYKWRKRVQDMKKADTTSLGAYQGWKVLLLTDKNKEDNFRRLLSAGGATVLNNKPPFTEDLSATHAFVELHKIDLSERDMDMLVSNVTNVLKPEFIASHLTDDPPPCPEEYTPPEVLALKNSLLDTVSRKRRAAEPNASGSTGKRSRR